MITVELVWCGVLELYTAVYIVQCTKLHTQQCTLYTVQSTVQSNIHNSVHSIEGTMKLRRKKTVEKKVNK